MFRRFVTTVAFAPRRFHFSGSLL